MRALAALALLSISVPAFGWNYEGHAIIASIAYARLEPKVRARVDELIRKHLDYGTILTKGAPADPVARARYAFLTAAAWPDIIRSDPRLFDETRPEAVPTSPIGGFPDTKRHPTWHYYDIPYSPDGTPGAFTPPPNAYSELQRLISEIRATKDEALAAYDLLWIEHLVGDIHQPLHATSRYLKSQPRGDAGGNFVFFAGGKTLHLIWDAAGDALSYEAGVNDPEALRYEQEVTTEYPEPQRLSLNPKDWIDESYALDKSDVYTFGLETGSREEPLQLPMGYEENARKISRRRIAMAGYRLAGVLNQQLR